MISIFCILVSYCLVYKGLLMMKIILVSLISSKLYVHVFQFMFCHFVRKLREEEEVVTPVCVIVNKRLVIVVFTICIHVVVLWSTRPRPINHTNTVLRSSADSPYFMALCSHLQVSGLVHGWTTCST